MNQGQVAKETWKCNNEGCKNINSNLERNCLNCGFQIYTWMCSNESCNNINSEENKTCIKCGSLGSHTWVCRNESCKNINSEENKTCIKCGSPGPHIWMCSNEFCKNINSEENKTCIKCGGSPGPRNERRKKKKNLMETLSYKWHCQTCDRKCFTSTCETCQMKCNDTWQCTCGERNFIAQKICKTCKQKLPNFSETAIGQHTLWASSSDLPVLMESTTRRILIVGIVGAGKSSFANSILGKGMFQSAPSFQSVTQNCTCGTCQRDGTNIIVFDTPGFLGVQLEESVEDIESVYKLFQSCFWATCPGFHAIAIVIGIGRFTREDCQVIDNIKRIFGPECMKYVVIVFTKIDSLEHKSLEDILQTADDRLKNYLEETLNTYVGINNKATGESNDKQIQNFLKKVEEVFERNNKSHYTSEIYEHIYNELKKEARQKEENEILTRFRFDFLEIFPRIKQWWNAIIKRKL